jgi:hypothetical protein
MKQTHVLTVNLNWDHRDHVKFYGRTQEEPLHLMGEWIRRELIEPFKNVPDPDYDNIPVPCLFMVGPGGVEYWLELTFSFEFEQVSISCTKDNNPRMIYRSYDYGDGVNVWASYMRLFGRWDVIPTDLAGLPEWLISGDRAFVNEKARQDQIRANAEAEARETAAQLKTAEGRIKEAQAKLEEYRAREVEKTINPIPLRLADDPDLAQWPHMPEPKRPKGDRVGTALDDQFMLFMAQMDAEEAQARAQEEGPGANVGPVLSRLFTAEEKEAPGPVGSGSPVGPVVTREGGIVAITFPPAYGHAFYTAVNMVYGAAGFGSTPEEAALDMLANAQAALETKIALFQEYGGPREEGYEEAAEGFKDVNLALAAVRKRVQAANHREAPNAQRARETAAAPEPAKVEKSVPDGRPMHYLYIGRRGNAYAWVRVNPGRQNTGDMLQEGRDDRRYFDGDSNLVPHAKIGEVYTFYLSNGKDEVIGVPYAFHSTWANAGDRSTWALREKITTGKGHN